jgi:dihydrofolate reductase
LATLVLKMSVAKPMNEIPKVVFSNSLASADWGETTIAAGDLAEAITRLKQEHAHEYLLAHGGTRFARSLVEAGLIVHPAVLGAGERIFPAPLTVEPTSTTRLRRRSCRSRLRDAPMIEPDR